jgi:hypothetical protein
MTAEPQWTDLARKKKELVQGRRWLQTHTLPKPVIETEAGDLAQRSLRGKVRRLLKQGKYADLEQLAKQLRTSRSASVEGEWDLEIFYEALTTPTREPSQADWAWFEKQIQTWAARSPGSVTAQSALAHSTIGLAWAARGGGYANEVKPAQWALFEERIARAEKILERSRKLRSQCPGWYRALQTVAKAQGWPEKEYSALTAEALKTFPGYFNFHSAKTNYLLPRWHGQQGDWERYATSAADAVGGEAGDILYARLVSNVEEQASGTVQNSDLSWPRIDRGFRALMKHYPNSLRVTSAYCHLAGWFQEFAVMQRLFQEKIGGRVDIGLWLSEKSFLESRSWAYGLHPWNKEIADAALSQS